LERSVIVLKTPNARGSYLQLFFGRTLLGSLHPVVRRIRPAYTKFRREGSMVLHCFAGSLPQHRFHVNGFNPTGQHFLLIAFVHAVNEIAIPLRADIEIVPERPIHKRIDNIAVCHEQLKMEGFQ
jgi:hypothetical protein